MKLDGHNVVGFDLVANENATWSSVYNALVRSPSRTFLRYPSTTLPPLPSPAYRFPPDASCRGMHAHTEGSDVVVHLDQVHPSCSVLQHLKRDAPGWLYGIGTCCGGLIGYVAGGVFGAVAGAGLGLGSVWVTKDSAGAGVA
jgi:hypothetical protein